jgi:hypothetical protein
VLVVVPVVVVVGRDVVVEVVVGVVVEVLVEVLEVVLLIATMVGGTLVEVLDAIGITVETTWDDSLAGLGLIAGPGPRGGRESIPQFFSSDPSPHSSTPLHVMFMLRQLPLAHLK